MPGVRRRSGFARRRRLRSSRRGASRFRRRIIRRPIRSSRRRFRRRGAGGRIRTGFGINPSSFTRHGRKLRISYRNRLRTVMALSSVQPFTVSNAGTLTANENAVNYGLIDIASHSDLINMAFQNTNVPQSAFGGPDSSDHIQNILRCLGASFNNNNISTSHLYNCSKSTSGTFFNLSRL